MTIFMYINKIDEIRQPRNKIHVKMIDVFNYKTLKEGKTTEIALHMHSEHFNGERIKNVNFVFGNYSKVS